MKIVISATTSWNIYNSRMPLITALSEQGHEVVLLSPQDEFTPLLIDAGFRWVHFPLKPRSKNVFRELLAIIFLIRFYLREKPDLVNHFTPKGVIYGSIAAKISKVVSIINTITGLGYVFSEKGNAKLQFLVTFLYRIALRRTFVIFQNTDNQDFFIKKGVVEQIDSLLILGSGINMEKFTPANKEPGGTPIVMLSSRFVEEKGIRYFVQASVLLKSRQIDARFVLVGKPEDDQPTAISLSDITHWVHQGIIEWWGWHNNMEEIYPLAHIVCLPTYYMEGVPKSLIEASACGRPLVATNVPGCREIVQHGENGILVPPQNTEALADAISQLVRDEGLRERMGRKSREIAVQNFSNKKVIEKYFEVYKIK